MSNFDKELLGKTVPAGVSAAWAEISKAKAQYKETNYTGVQADQVLGLVRQLDKYKTPKGDAPYAGILQDSSIRVSRSINGSKFYWLSPRARTPVGGASCSAMLARPGLRSTAATTQAERSASTGSSTSRALRSSRGLTRTPASARSSTASAPTYSPRSFLPREHNNSCPCTDRSGGYRNDARAIQTEHHGLGFPGSVATR
jgi:hypothetical protein